MVVGSQGPELIDMAKVETRSIWFWQADRYLNDGWQLYMTCFGWGTLIEALVDNIRPTARRITPQAPLMKIGDVVSLQWHGQEYVGTVTGHAIET